MFWKKFARDYLSFSRRDRIGILVLLSLIALIYLLPLFFKKKPGSLPFSRTSIMAHTLDSLRNRQEREKKQTPSKAQTVRIGGEEAHGFAKGSLFRFNPNTLDSSGWRRLGLSERVTRTILNYRNKGGKFFRPQDIQKIHGLPDDFYEWVKDSIDLVRSGGNVSTTAPRSRTDQSQVSIVWVNEADSAEWEALPGIGGKLAARIVNYRNKLGGFYSIEQVGETYGLADSTFQKIKPYLKLSGNVKKININRADKEILRQHPYIKWNIANAIVEYRKQHGLFEKLEDLKKIGMIDEGVYAKIARYLEVE